MTRTQAIAIIAADMVERNAGEFTLAQCKRTLGAWYTDAELVESAREISLGRPVNSDLADTTDSGVARVSVSSRVTTGDAMAEGEARAMDGNR